LMSQTQKWQEVVKLAEEANQKGLKPELLVEYIPFIEGYAYMGNWKKALDLSDKVNRLHPDFQPGLCLLWESLLQVKTGEDIRTAVRIAKDMLDCE